MSLITKDKLYKYAEKASLYERYDASIILLSSKAVADDIIPDKKYNIFLCHSSLDAKTILGLREYFTHFGFTTYIDWIDDHQLDRSKVDRETANLLRKRMQNSDCLLYASSDNSPDSKWMPWECGYFDGIKSRVAICPISESATQSLFEEYNKQEYLSLYPYLTNDLTQGTNKENLWIKESQNKYHKKLKVSNGL